ncbi:hypothetical protein PRIPAC_98040, partial [Pristionchus pacificus]
DFRHGWRISNSTLIGPRGGIDYLTACLVNPLQTRGRKNEAPCPMVPLQRATHIRGRRSCEGDIRKKKKG